MVPIALRRAAALAVCAAACYFLFFYNLTGVGMLGPDEPRYASIGREMARSGDWLTPRLWGDAWFEKPPLVYWMIAAGFRLGLSEDLAPRLPVAFAAVLFLAIYWRVLRNHFGRDAALYSTLILATSAAWLGFSHTAVTDLPMAAAFSAAMLLSLGWIETGDRRGLAAAGALLGLAVLAKGFVPLVLALPVLWARRTGRRELLRPGAIAAFLAIAAPWYIAMLVLHGRSFFDDFFLKQHLARFATSSLQHVQPVWFYVPVLLAGLFPWTPLLVTLFSRALCKDPRIRFLLWWAGFGFVFFSASANKLPGYLLPLLPAVAALCGIRLEQVKRPVSLVLAAGLLALVPVVAAILPPALVRGVTHAGPLAIQWLAFVPFAAAAATVAFLTWRNRRSWAVLSIAAVTVAALVWLEGRVFPAMDGSASARGLWTEIRSRRNDLCVAAVNRGWRYNLNYYSDNPLPGCETAPRRLRIEQPPGQTPQLVLTSLSDF